MAPRITRPDLSRAAALLAVGADVEAAARLADAPLETLQALEADMRWLWRVEVYRRTLPRCPFVALIATNAELALDVDRRALARDASLQAGQAKASRTMLKALATAPALHSAVNDVWKREKNRIPREFREADRGPADSAEPPLGAALLEALGVEGPESFLTAGADQPSPHLSSMSGAGTQVLRHVPAPGTSPGGSVAMTGSHAEGQEPFGASTAIETGRGSASSTSVPAAPPVARTGGRHRSDTARQSERGS